MSRRKPFFRGFQVLRAKNRVYGEKLPPDQVLVKLCEADKPPIWAMLKRDTFDREKCYREILYPC